MSILFKTVGVLFFFATPFSFVWAVYQADWRFFFIGLILFFFSLISLSLANTIDVSKKKALSLEEMFKQLDEKKLSDLED